MIRPRVLGMGGVGTLVLHAFELIGKADLLLLLRVEALGRRSSALIEVRIARLILLELTLLRSISISLVVRGLVR